jgi:hypothetical protein
MRALLVLALLSTPAWAAPNEEETDRLIQAGKCSFLFSELGNDAGNKAARAIAYKVLDAATGESNAFLVGVTYGNGAGFALGTINTMVSAGTMDGLDPAVTRMVTMTSLLESNKCEELL